MPSIAHSHRPPWPRVMRAAFIGLLAAATLAVGFARHGNASDDSLYRGLGGKDRIVKIIDVAMTKWLTDPRILDEFDNINIERLKSRISDQICQIAGGPCQYTGRDMYASHKGLHLNQAKFNALAEDLQLAMDELEIPFSTQNRLMALLAAMQRDVVTR